MDLIPSKLYHYLLNPLSICLLLVIISYLLTLRVKKAAAPVLITSIGLLWISSTPALSSYLIASLEHKFLPVPVSESPTTSAVVVLGSAGGAIEPPRIEVDLTGASDRIRHAARLYQSKKAPVVIVSGGGSNPIPEAGAMNLLLQEWGVPEEAIITETRSLNTYQNAVNTKKLLEARGLDTVLLVTSAMHMPRALAAFRTAEIKAVPSPTDYAIVDRQGFTVKDFFPDAGALGGTTVALREYLGILVYRWLGWIK